MVICSVQSEVLPLNVIQQEPCRYESSVNNLACDSTAAHCQLLDKLVQANVEAKCDEMSL